MSIPTKGFSLIELMIAIAIIAILATLAIPNYREYTARAKRSDAQGALVGLSSAFERYYSESYTYLGAASEDEDNGPPAATLYPSQAPISGGTKYYNLTIVNATATSYELRATPIGEMLGDRCGTFSFNSAGAKGAAETNCWRL